MAHARRQKVVYRNVIRVLSPLAAAGWLAVRYCLSPQEATKEAMDVAEHYDIVRLGDTSKLAAWLQG